jgi:serine/threonine-protein kinase
VSSSLQEQVQRALGNAYLLERELGGGGMSRVFLALESSLNRRVVVKVLLPELAAGVNVERFRREILLAAQLQHPHIVPLLSAGEAEGLPYFIMPYVIGESLRTRVTREGEFPIADTVRILRDVVSALAYAHAHGVVHRDVKPDNVLLSGGVAVVTDFGVAKAVSASAGTPGSTGLTSLGVALGTPAYMAPEQATASPNTDHRADIYALGVVAYEMLTGSPPFAGRSAPQTLAAHVVEEPEPVERRRPAVPPMLAGLVRDCLAKRPADRPQRALDVMQLLDTIATTPGGGTAATTAVRLPAGGYAAPGRKTWPLVAGGAALLALLGAGLLWLRPSPPSVVPVGAAADSNPAATMVPAADSSLTRIHSEHLRALPPESPAARPPLERTGEAAPPARKPRRDQARTPTPKPAAPIAPETLAPGPAAEAPAAIESAPSPPAAAAPSAVAPTPPSPPPPSPVTLPAPAAKPADPAPEIRSLLAQYAAAVESRSLPDLQRVYPGMTDPQQNGWQQFFRLVRDVQARLSLGQLRVTGNTAESAVTGTYTYLNTSTGRAESQAVSFQASFSREGGRWRISQVR